MFATHAWFSITLHSNPSCHSHPPPFPPLIFHAPASLPSLYLSPSLFRHQLTLPFFHFPPPILPTNSPPEPHNQTTVAASIVGTLIILANASLIIWTCVDLAHLNPSSPPSTESNLIRIIFTVLASLLLLLYLITLALLALRPISTATYQPTKDELAKAAAVAKAHDLAIDTYTNGGPGGDSKGGDSQGGERRDLEAGWGGVRSDGVRLEGAAAAESAESEAAAAAAGAAAAEAAEASAAAAAASALARSRASMTAGSNVAPGASGASDAAGTAAASFSASELSTNVAVSAATEASLNDWLKDAEKRP
ncbi:unnamed protein product [Closterium sp. NIES-54]